MLTLRDTRDDRNCQGFGRREFLRIGGLGLGGLSLPSLLAARAGGVASVDYVNDVSVVLLFLQGGPSHIEFFDPKLTAPSEIRSVTGEVKTQIPGVTFGGTFPLLAGMTDKLAIVRSYASNNSGHTYAKVTTGGNPLDASMGAIYSRVAGANDAATGIPNHTLVLPEAIQDGLKLGSNFETSALPSLTQPGELGPSFAPFNPAGGGVLREDMQLRIDADRLLHRRSLLARLDRLRRRTDKGGLLDGADKFHQQAFEVITRGVVDAFDLSRESPSTLARYDTTGVFRVEEIQKYNDMRRSTNLLGHQLLLARRLCEAGCGFVTVSDCGWDMHANNNSPKQMAGIWPLGSQVDRAVSAFVEDIHQRGLDKKILLVVTGEMGRTPRINNNGGRDHYGGLTSLLLAGGGIHTGQVIGQSDAQATKPATEPYGPEHLLATVMHRLFDVGQLRLDPSLPRDLSQVITSGEPIPGLL
jgi:hypothetical protein